MGPLFFNKMNHSRPLIEWQLQQKTLDAYWSSESELSEHDSNSVLEESENGQDDSEIVQEQSITCESIEDKDSERDRQYFFQND